jgi:hypothetical protein
MRRHWTVLLVTTIAVFALAGCRLVQRRRRSKSSPNHHLLGGHPWRRAAAAEPRETDLLWIG